MRAKEYQSNGGISVGVIGVGAMGQNHARIYDELQNVKFVGVTDVDKEQASRIAERYGTKAMGLYELYDSVDAVSVAVPTKFHFEIARECLKRGIHTVVEKPFVLNPANGEELIRLADEHGMVLQVGHIERFNPAYRALADVVPDLNIISIHAERLGPPPQRTIGDNAVLDLMIHDIDIIRTMIDEEPIRIEATGVHDNHCVTASLTYESDIFASLTASRLTQKKIRTLEITAESCFVAVDYIDHSVEIHRQSMPEYIHVDGDLRYRHEGIVERPVVNNGEPLKLELESFIDAIVTGSQPVVTGEDGLRALELALEIDGRSKVSREAEQEISP